MVFVSDGLDDNGDSFVGVLPFRAGMHRKMQCSLKIVKTTLHNLQGHALQCGFHNLQGQQRSETWH
jgi:hypothetical protein